MRSSLLARPASMTSDVEHRPGPAPDEPPYHRYCVADGELWPCAERLASLPPAPEPVRRDLELGEEQLVLRVGIGWHIEGREGLPHHQRVGGTVVGYRDDEDDRRTFRTLNWHRGRPITVDIASVDVEPAGVREFDGYGLEAHATALAEFVGRGGGKDHERLEWLKLATLCMERALCPT